MSTVYLLIMILSTGSSGSSITVLKQPFQSNDACLQVENQITSDIKQKGGTIYSSHCYQTQN